MWCALSSLDLTATTQQETAMDATTTNGACDLDGLGRRWEAGEKITKLAAECGMSWNALHFQLMKRGFKTEGAGRAAAPAAPPPAPMPTPARPTGKTHKE